MNAGSEYLPATAGTRQELVLLHGWGSGRDIWRPLLAQLRPWANVTLVDVPGCAASVEAPATLALEEALEALLQRAPARAVYVGWSLGGQLAVELALRHPDRVAAVVTVCSNPRFVAAGDWPGMPAHDFAGFCAGFLDNPRSALQRFESLQVAGSPGQRQLRRQLKALRHEPPCTALQAGLEWLQSLDQCGQLASLAQPQLHLLGELDELVPAGVGEPLAELLSGLPTARVATLAGCAHVAPLEAHGQLAREITGFLAAHDLLPVAPVAVATPAKADIAESFSRAASRYDSVATLQRDVGARLLASLDSVPEMPSVVLDLGCGTGFFYPELRRRFPQAAYIGLDLAPGMVAYAREQFPEAGRWLVGDAEALPLAAASVDLVFSSLAIQWCYRPGHLFAELARVLRPGGRCVFTSLGPGTLQELRAAWAAVDAHQHVNSFLPAADLLAAARAVPGLTLALDGDTFRMDYQRVRDLLTELKILGAHNMNRNRPPGLMGRRTLQGMLQAYEQWREGGLLPATYDVLFGELEKS